MNIYNKIFLPENLCCGTLIRFENEKDGFYNPLWRCFMTDHDCLLTPAYLTSLCIAESTPLLWHKCGKKEVIFPSGAPLDIYCSFSPPSLNFSNLPSLTLHTGEIFILEPNCFCSIIYSKKHTAHIFSSKITTSEHQRNLIAVSEKEFSEISAFILSSETNKEFLDLKEE